MTTESSKDSDWIYVKGSSIHHKGLFAFKDIPKGMRIIEFVGEKITKEESVRRIDEDPSKSDLMHIFDLDDEYDLDLSNGKNDAIYVNHSCEPNCEVEDEGDKLFLHSAKDIKKDEEITFDYDCAFDVEIVEEGCKCGSPNCRGCIVNEEDIDKLKDILRKTSIEDEDIKELKKIFDDNEVNDENIRIVKKQLKIL